MIDLFKLLSSAKPGAQPHQLISVAATAGALLEQDYGQTSERVAYVVEQLLRVEECHSLCEFIWYLTTTTPLLRFSNQTEAQAWFDKTSDAVAGINSACREATGKDLARYTLMQCPVDAGDCIAHLPVGLAPIEVSLPAVYASAPTAWSYQWARAVAVAKISSDLNLHKLSTYRIVVQDCILRTEAEDITRLSSPTYWPTLRNAVGLALTNAHKHLDKLGIPRAYLY